MKKRLVAMFLIVFFSLSFSLVLAQDAPSAPGGDFAQIDTDGDGKITRDEFMAFQEMKFKKMDTNSDGVLTQEEITEAFRALRERRLKGR